jgi:hypothetical protein
MPRLILAAAALLALATSSTTLAQQELGGLLRDDVGQRQLTITPSFETRFGAAVPRQDDRLSLHRYGLALSVPLQQDERNEWTLDSSLRILDLDTDARLLAGGLRRLRPAPTLPGELYDFRIGPAYRRRLDNGWIAGGNLVLGSASDRPFASAAEITVDASAFLRIPDGPRNAWLLLLNYASNREFLPHVPLPGVAYLYEPDDRFRAVLGAPFSAIRYEPLDGLTFEGSYFVPRSLKAELGYRLAPPLKLYAGYQWANDRFLRAARDDDDHRLFYYEQRVLAGLRWDIDRNIWLDLGGGFAFDRFFAEARDYGDRGHRRAEVSDGPLLKLELGLRL